MNNNQQENKKLQQRSRSSSESSFEDVKSNQSLSPRSVNIFIEYSKPKSSEKYNQSKEINVKNIPNEDYFIHIPLSKTSLELHRGTKDLENLENIIKSYFSGKPLELPFSSFTKDVNVAKIFGESGYMLTIKTPNNKNHKLHGCDVSKYSKIPDEKEYITGGNNFLAENFYHIDKNSNKKNELTKEQIAGIDENTLKNYQLNNQILSIEGNIYPSKEYYFKHQKAYQTITEKFNKQEKGRRCHCALI